ncbi:MAG: Uma2 family endonuclease [Acidimicrobiales bacterium]
MKAVILDVDQRTLAERAQLGLDVRDEMWEGVLHMVPSPLSRHQLLGTWLVVAMMPLVVERGWLLSYETEVGVAADDYRVPDLVVYPPESRVRRGIAGPAALIIEIRSPGDETYEKLPWYLAGRAQAVLIVDCDSLAVELYTADGRLPNGDSGAVFVEALGVAVGPEGGVLRIGEVRVELPPEPNQRGDGDD